MKSKRFFYVGIGTFVFSVALLPTACGDSTTHPTNVDSDKEGGIIPTIQKESGAADVGLPDTARPDVAALDSGTSDAGDAALDVDAGPPGCSDGVKEPPETDVDCGGTVCKKCVDGKTCITNTDCVGGWCTPNDAGTGSVCITPTCTDKIKDGTETDVDCGGPTCFKCTIGKACGGGLDCTSGNCANNACACQAGMVSIPRAAALGGAYCIDGTEVQNGQYYAFIQANQAINGQITQCLTNATFVPQGAWPPPLSAYGLPVRYVDWCDASAYCRWAGKQLCGLIGGGTLPYTLVQANDASESAWFNACSAEGVNAYPYPGTFSAAACNGGSNDGGTPGPWPVWAYDTNGVNQNQALNTSCFGGGNNQLYQMSGNVAEWEDSCSGATGGSDTCRLRGGSYNSANSPTDLACTGDRTATRLNPTPAATPELFADVGFRCCQY
jgi:formylglycine-generating enzyme required for sulfatase activity